jgi:hypothetical protein
VRGQWLVFIDLNNFSRKYETSQFLSSARNYEKSPDNMHAYARLVMMVSLQAGWTAMNHTTPGEAGNHAAGPTAVENPCDNIYLTLSISVLDSSNKPSFNL